MVLRGIRWRLAASLLTVLTSAIAVGAALLGPLYLRTAGDSVIRSTIAAAPSYSPGVTLAPRLASGLSLEQLEAQQASLTRRFGLDAWYRSPITSVFTGVGLSGPDSSPLRGQLVYRSGICAVLKFQAGACDLRPGRVLVSGRTARELRVAVGSTLHVSVRGSSEPLPLRISGIYRVPDLDLPYWWGEGVEYFPFGYPSGPQKIPQIDGLVTSRATAVAVPKADASAYMVQLPFRAGSVGLQNQGAVQRALAGATRDAGTRDIALSGQLPDLLAEATRQRHLMTTIVAVAAVQLLLLAVWVLTALLLRSAELRRDELRVARLRGFPAGSLLAVAVVEPALLCAAGTLVGVIGAWVVVVIAKEILLYPTATVSVGPLVFAGFAAAILTIAAALAMTALRLVRGSGLGESVQPDGATAGRARLVADVAILVLSAVALVALVTSGALASHDNPIAAAAPGLLALATAVIAVQLVLLACRRGIALTADSTAVPWFLALRQVVRRPAVLREGRVLIIALCLASFATCAWSVARSNRSTAATFAVGAETVATVTPRGDGLQAAVDKVDPSGRFAMAAVQISTSSTRLLAVDSSRLAAVASWPNGLTRADVESIGRMLRPRTVPQVNLPSGSVRVQASAVGVGAISRSLVDLIPSLWVFNSRVGTTIIPLGRLGAGVHWYTGSLVTSCPGGCRLVGIGLVPAAGHQLPAGGHVELTLRRIQGASGSDRVLPVSAGLRARDWRATAPGVGIQRSPGVGVRFVFPAVLSGNYESAVGSVTPAMASIADYPLNLPGVVDRVALYGASTSGTITTVPSQGIDGGSISIAPVAVASALPRLGSDAEMVDLTLLSRAQVDPGAPGANDEVWLGPQTPDDALARLRAAGLQIDRVQAANRVFSALQRTGPALAYDFMLVATMMALLTAAASTLGVLGSVTRQRATELTTLEIAGLRRSALVWSLVIEAAILALTALFGTLAGVVGAALALPALPELGSASLVPLSYALPVPLIILVSLAIVLVVALATTVAATGVVGRMSPTLLRSASSDVGS